MNKILLWLVIICFLLLTIHGAAAAMNDSIVAYWSMNSCGGTVSDLTGNNHVILLTGSGAYCSGAGVNSGAIALHPTSNASWGPNITTNRLAASGDQTLSAWVYDNQSGVSGADWGAIFHQESYGVAFFANWSVASAPNSTVVQYISATYTTIPKAYAPKEWHNIIMTTDGSSTIVYVDGVQRINNSGSFDFDATKAQRFFSFATVNNQNWGGRIDEVGVWDRYFNSSDAAQIAANTTLSFYPFTETGTSPTTNTYIVNIKDLFDDSNLAGATVTMGGTTNITDGSGIAIFYNFTGNQNYNASKTGYFNISGIVAANTTSTNNMTQGHVNITSIRSLITETTLSADLGAWTVNTSGGKTYAECAGTYPCLIYLQNGTNSITLQYSGAGTYYPLSFQVNITAPQTTTRAVTGVYDEILLVLSKFAGSLITNSTEMTVSNTTYSFTSNCTTTSGSCSFNIEKGLYYFVESNPAGYRELNTTHYGNASSENITFSHLLERTFNFTIMEEITRTLLNDTFSLELISDDEATNYTITTGLLNISLLTPNEYTIRYSAANYPERDYYETILAESYFNITLYAISFNDSVDTLVTVLDTSNSPVEGATVKLLRYYVYCNCYEVVEMAKTSSSGQAYFNAQSIEGHYKWIVQLDGNTYFTSTTPENLLPDPTTGIITRVFTINLGQAFYESYQGFRNLSQTFTKTFTPLTNQTTLVYTWNDANNVVAEACLEAEYLDGVDFETYDITCSTDSAGSLVMVLNDSQDRKYKYRVSLDSGTTYSIENVFTGWTDDVADYDFGNTGYFMGAIILIVLALAMSFSVVAVTVTVVIGVAAISALGIAPFSLDFIAGLIAMMVGIVAYLYRQG